MLRLEYLNKIKQTSFINLILKDDCSIEVEIDFGGVDYYDYTINFLSEFDNQETFYTDSNSLYFVKRVIKKPLKYSEHFDNYAPANYYPVTSAILLEDIPTGRHMVVTTDRTYGGSVLVPGRIELMWNRRSDVKDGLGVEEFLDERDTNR